MPRFGRLHSNLSRMALALLAWGCAATSAVGADSSPAPAAGAMTAQDVLHRAFSKLDLDQSGGLSEEEYRGTAQQGTAPRTRDFKLFDFDGSKTLSFSEFSAIPGPVQPADRGSIPDPFEELLDQAVAAMDEAYGQWDRKPAFQVPVHGFVEGFTKSLASDGQPRLTTEVIREADPDQSGLVTRDEARRFLEIQLGLRRSKGEPLRESTGRVVNYALFLNIDADRNDRLEQTEFVERGSNPDKEKALAIFAKGDLDRSGWLSFEEFSRNIPSGMNDPIEQFRRMDTNLDAALDPAEILAGTPEWQKPLARTVFPGFDSDGNGTLSLAEYQLTMQANMILGWQGKLNDADRDSLLSYEEFTFDRGQFPLLRRLMFTRLDRSGDSHLTQEELAFPIRMPDALFVLEADGTGWRKLTDSKEYPNCGSPAVSPDGKWIAFDGYAPTGGYGTSKLFVIALDGTGRREVAAGLMPTWSPDGKQLACSRYEEGNTVWIMNLDGTPGRKIGDGWGAQWSPDGKTIAYTRDTSLVLYDVATDSEREAFKAGEVGYSYLYYNMAWSPDSRRICFRGTKDNNVSELASVAVGGDKRDVKVHYGGPRAFDNDPCWSPDGRKLYLGLQSTEHKRHLIHELDVAAGGEPRLVPGQDVTVAAATNSCWTPDGRHLIIRARPQ